MRAQNPLSAQLVPVCWNRQACDPMRVLEAGSSLALSNWFQSKVRVVQLESQFVFSRLIYFSTCVAKTLCTS